MRVTILGSGTSFGVPMIGCDCAVCRSPDPRNRRCRASICIEHRGQTLLIDTPPELRLQALAADLRRVDAVLITHTHADHIFGLDDLRQFTRNGEPVIPVYADDGAQADIRRIFRYIFVPTQEGGGKPRIDLRPLADRLDIIGLPVEPLTVMHGVLPIQAFRIGQMAYVTDTNHIPPGAMERLRGLDLLILDAVRIEPHPTHYGLHQAVAVARELSPRRTLLTHLSHQMDHEATNAALPAGIEMAYDGQTVDVPLP